MEDRERYGSFARWVAMLPEVDFAGDDAVEITDLWSEVERRAGHGSSALAAMGGNVDDLGLVLTLECRPLRYDTHARELNGEDGAELDRLDALNERGLGEADLLRWYERHGFVVTGTDDSDIPSMAWTTSPSSGP